MIDHLLWAVPDLEGGRRRFAELAGVEPARGGRHPGVGTENALLDLGDERYLEVIALDPTQTERSSLGLALEGLREPGLFTWCIRAPDVEAIASAARRAGLDAGKPTAMSRERPDGSRLEWRLLFLGGHDEGLLLPFFIEWVEGTVHPSRGAPGGCRLERFVLVHPAPEKLSALVAALGLEVGRAGTIPSDARGARDASRPRKARGSARRPSGLLTREQWPGAPASCRLSVPEGRAGSTGILPARGTPVAFNTARHRRDLFQRLLKRAGT